MDSPLRTLSLCSGVGGLDLGVSRAVRVQPVGYVERDAYAATVLLERMEEAAMEPALIWVGNLQDLDARPLRGHVDLVTAGIPCQPWSLAGAQKGQEDERHLGDELLRIVREVGPRYVFVENVAGFVRPEGLGHLAGRLSEIGFDAEWATLRASDVGAPHLRRRVFMLAYAADPGARRGEQLSEGGEGPGNVAHATGDGRSQGRTKPEGEQGRPDTSERGDAPHADREVLRQEQGGAEPGGPGAAQPRADGAPGFMAHGANTSPVLRPALKRCEPNGDCEGAQEVANADDGGRHGRAGEFGPSRWGEPTDPGWWATEPNVGRVAHGVPSRVDRLRCLGNAVVPAQAERAFRELWGRIV